jgi:type II secretory pathway pseudopilin PulG
MKRLPTKRQRNGFTIMEAAISVAIVGILVASSMTAMGQIAKARTVQAEQRAAYELNHQLMIEILSQYFVDPGTNTTRATFNGVNDYNGYTESPPTRKDGTVLTDYSGWTRSVTVAYVDPNDPANAVSNSTLESISVTATAPSGKKYTLTGLRSQYGPYEYTPPSQTNIVTWVGVDLQAGGQVANIRTAARPLNETDSQ